MNISPEQKTEPKKHSVEENSPLYFFEGVIPDDDFKFLKEIDNRLKKSKINICTLERMFDEAARDARLEAETKMPGDITKQIDYRLKLENKKRNRLFRQYDIKDTEASVMNIILTRHRTICL